MSRVYNFIFKDAISTIKMQCMSRPLLEDEFFVYYHFFLFLINSKPIPIKDIASFGKSLIKARLEEGKKVPQSELNIIHHEIDLLEQQHSLSK